MLFRLYFGLHALPLGHIYLRQILDYFFCVFRLLWSYRYKYSSITLLGWRVFLYAVGHNNLTDEVR
jgi:hypothetical protein